MGKRFAASAAWAFSVAMAALGPLSIPAIALGAEPTTVSVNPRGAYLRTNSDTPLEPLRIDLAALGILPGDLVRLERLGAWDCGGPCADTVTTMSGVFSAGNALLATSQPHRVPGAIEAGANIVTGPTFNGSLPNDIPEDFPIADTTIEVPTGATHLFVAAPDSLYSDNSDPNGDFKIRISEVDATPPAIVPSVAGTLGGGGWYVSDVSVSWSVTDAASAVSSTSGCETTTLTADTAGTTLTCTATSAGGTDSESVTIRVDQTAPSISASRSPDANDHGWNKTNVTVAFVCSDALSGLASCTAPVTFGAEGSGQTATGTVTDVAGNEASATVDGINIDKTAPSITASRSPGANANGWSNTDVTVSFVCSDALSGTASCTSPVVFTAEGVGLTATGTATDLAGNEASATVDGIDIDKTAPTVVYTGNSLAYTIDEQIEISCTVSDALSGVDSDTCADVSGPASAFPLGANTYSATALDLAGNQGIGSTTFVVLVTGSSLCNLVRALSDDDGIANSLCAKLDAAEASEVRGNLHARAGQLRAFVHELEAQSGKAFTAEEAAMLIALGGAL